MNKLTLVMAALLLAACGGQKGDRTASQNAVDSATVAAAPAAQSADSSAPALTDAQIAAIVTAANQVDIEAGRLAESRATNAQVKSFARQMVADHSGVNKAVAALATKLGVTPEESQTSRQLTDGGAQNRASLQGKSGRDFDRAYIENEVAYHQAVIDAIDKMLIPSAQNAELKAMLVQTRGALEAHLKMAKDARQSV